MYNRLQQVYRNDDTNRWQLVENTITELSHEHHQDFHVVRLNGFIHTDDKIALREIWRQLGKEMQVEDDLLNRVSTVHGTAIM